MLREVLSSLFLHYHALELHVFHLHYDTYFMIQVSFGEFHALEGICRHNFLLPLWLGCMIPICFLHFLQSPVTQPIVFLEWAGGTQGTLAELQVRAISTSPTSVTTGTLTVITNQFHRKPCHLKNYKTHFKHLLNTCCLTGTVVGVGRDTK